MHLPFLPPSLTTKKPPPKWDPFTPAFSRLSQSATAHPVQTMVIVALLASTTYIQMLENSLFDRSSWGQSGSKRADLMDGSARVSVGQETGWQWKENTADEVTGAKHVALVSLSFPPQSLATSSPVLPSTSATELESEDPATKVFSVPYDELPGFISSIKVVPAESTEEGATKQYTMQTGRKSSSGNLISRAEDAVRNVWDLIQNADSLDVVIMALGYISMHLSFISLFLQMRRLGSNFWLGATVLISSTFAFLFASIVTHKLGVPINMVLLSEGLPFLVVIIGFEKPIVLTRAVLDAHINLRNKSNVNASIQSAVVAAVQETGFLIVRDYVIEIAILAVGAASGVQGGLRQFCFLAAWILTFDCILLFSFYTAILSVKLEINRIKRHVALRKALEEDGVSHRVAESVAKSNEWPRAGADTDETTSVFGAKVKDSSIRSFKIWMVAGFFLVNLINLFTLPYRDATSTTVLTTGADSMVSEMNVFQAAGKQLEQLLASREALTVTVLQPIVYQLQHASIFPSSVLDAAQGYHPNSAYENAELFTEGPGSKMVDSILRSLNDPVLGKWIIASLIISLAFNGYLFNAARYSLKEPTERSEKTQVVERIVTVNCTCGGKGEARPTTNGTNGEAVKPEEVQSSRTIAECEVLLKAKRAKDLTNAELVELAVRKKIPGYALEKTLGDSTRAVVIRRAMVARDKATIDRTGRLEHSLLPYKDYDYDRVLGACCENVIGYMPLPLGLAGPMTIDGEEFYIPMATTEGVLVASTSRGAKAINMGGGAVTILTGDGMTRGPVVQFPNVRRAGTAKNWIDSEEGTKALQTAFNSTSRFARLKSIKVAIAGTYLYIRFKTTTGDAMGMNMISKGVEAALSAMQQECGFDDMDIISVSGNYCTDKKPAAINWIDGRGKSVVAEAIIPAHVCQSVLKCGVDDIISLNTAKNYIGSAMAGSIGGFNAHAANIVTAVFLATGQDPAQNVESSNCITVMNKTPEGNLSISVSMPSIEVGTVGGGTILEPQGAVLDMLGVRGPHLTNPGDNARRLARIVAAAVLAGELSLNSALAAGHLVQSHMAHNRSQPTTRTNTPAPTPVIEAGSVAKTLTASLDQQRGITR
ncbi:putative 3-hydroxy-3-methylglutaryl CoA reductase [Sphaerosporella brunnea]|uniref:3-hydroxy-3-methylglutaryl coenzyme A reductase n=1 Tax=Sphaerosporella brunnea TaxID=1250544 RepID=A0A5J5F2D8_9PEZI|nr:putative 3-hydroxy-3-methylglutaryl CoA reductase [Sphaerosporella brunnea]